MKWITDLIGEKIRSRDFWKDVAYVGAIAAAIYIVWIVVEYWPEILEGFRRGWEDASR